MGSGSSASYTFYVGPHYEVQLGAGQALSVTKYYYFGSQRVAEALPALIQAPPYLVDNLYYLHADHLGSTLVATDASGALAGSAARYDAYGNDRYGTVGQLPTDYDYTGQKLDGTGFYQMGARWYDPYLDQWIQPDTIVPDLTNPQSLNPYSYVGNNPLRYTDPTGHMECDASCGLDTDGDGNYTGDGGGDDGGGDGYYTGSGGGGDGGAAVDYSGGGGYDSGDGGEGYSGGGGGYFGLGDDGDYQHGIGYMPSINQWMVATNYTDLSDEPAAVLLARVIFGEAGRESMQGQEELAGSVLVRAAENFVKYGNSVTAQILRYGQYSEFNPLTKDPGNTPPLSGNTAPTMDPTTDPTGINDFHTIYDTLAKPMYDAMRSGSDALQPKDETGPNAIDSVRSIGAPLPVGAVGTVYGKQNFFQDPGSSRTWPWTAPW